MKETKQLTQVNNAMVKKALLKAGKVVAGLGLIAALSGGCSQPTGGGGTTNQTTNYGQTPWGQIALGSYCGPTNPDPLLCYANVNASMAFVDNCHTTVDCVEKTQNVFLNALFHQWEILHEGKGLGHDLNKAFNINPYPVLQRYMHYGFDAIPCVSTSEILFARSAADAWDCSKTDWNAGQLGR